MFSNRVGISIVFDSGLIIDLKNHTGKSDRRRQLLFDVIDKGMSAEQRREKGMNGLLNAGRYADPFLRRTFSFGFGIQKMAR